MLVSEWSPPSQPSMQLDHFPASQHISDPSTGGVRSPTGPSPTILAFMRRHPIFSGISALMVAWLIACYFFFIKPSVDRPQHADAVIVLAGASDRLPVARKLKGVAPILVLSNSIGPGNEPANKQCQAASGPDVICFTPTPPDTRGEAAAIAKLVAQHDWKSIVVVTSTYHITRARILVKQATSIKVYMVASKPKGSIAQWAWWLVHETGGLIDAVVARSECAPARSAKRDLANM